MRNDPFKRYVSAMEDLQFSADTKESMIQMLMNQTAQPANKRRPGRRKLLLVALAAALALVTLTGGAVFTRWSKSMGTIYSAGEKEKQIAEKTGVSSMLETNADDTDVISVTDQGVTITAVQTIADQNYARLVFRVDGFDLPDGETPDVTIGSVRLAYGAVHCVNYLNGFFDGTVRNEEGEQVYADGSPLQYNSDGSPLLNYVAGDGSLEFYTTLTIPTPGAHIGNEVEVTIMSIGTTSRPGLVRGNWTLKWKLDGEKNILRSDPNAPIGDTGITLLKTEISPIAISVLLQVDGADLRTDKTELLNHADPMLSEMLDQAANRFVGIRTKDGVLQLGLGLTKASGFRTVYGDYAVSNELQEYRDSVRKNNAVLLRSSKQTNRIIDPEQVDAILFLKEYPCEKELSELTKEDLYLIPIQ